MGSRAATTRRRRVMKKFLSVFIAALFMSMAASSLAQAAEIVGTVAGVAGDATLVRDGSNKAEVITNGMKIMTKDNINTGMGGKVRMEMADGSVLMLGPKSNLVVREYMVKLDGNKRKSILGLLSGKLRAIANKAFSTVGNKFEVHTPTAVAGVMGTDLGVDVAVDGTTLVITITGLVNVNGTNVPPGQQGVVGADGKVTTGYASAVTTLNLVFDTADEAEAAKEAVEAALTAAKEADDAQAAADKETDAVKKAELQKTADQKKTDSQTATNNAISKLTPAMPAATGTQTTTTTTGETTTKEMTSEETKKAVDQITSGGGGGGGGGSTSPTKK